MPVPLRLVGLSILLGTATGCDGSRTPVPVSGTVTLEGKPVEGATVTFHLIGEDRDGQPPTGQTDKTGTFHLTTGNEVGARPGEYKVIVVKTVLEGPRMKMPDFPDTPEGRNQREHFLWKQFRDDQLPYRNILPKKYGDPSTTPLTCRVPVDGRVQFPLSRK